MSVPTTFLGLLEPGPNHGYELKHDYDRLFGTVAKGLSFGQVYATLKRLEQRGSIAVEGASPGEGPDRKRYALTASGAAELDRWLATPEAPQPHVQPVLFVKIVLALLSDRPAADHLDAQRTAHLDRMRELNALRKSGSLVPALLADFGLFHLEADLRWMDLTSARLDQLRAEITLQP